MNLKLPSGAAGLSLLLHADPWDQGNGPGQAQGLTTEMCRRTCIQGKPSSHENGEHSVSGLGSVQIQEQQEIAGELLCDHEIWGTRDRKHYFKGLGIRQKRKASEVFGCEDVQFIPEKSTFRT